ncbi:MAG: glycosyl hydrolase, partial [Chitinophagaceae bacterium]
MIHIDTALSTEDLRHLLERFWELSANKIRSIDEHYDSGKGSPVFTVKGQYTTRGWTEWTQGFQYGSSLLQFDATGDEYFLETARKKTVAVMAPHVSHIGVHDHGFNNVSTYGNLLRLMKEGKLPHNQWEKHFYELALKISGAVQATRWTRINHGGFIYSFNGPHSLFVDTIRSCRAVVLSHSLGHVFQAENDVRINLLERALLHCKATALFSVYYGEGRDSYDIPGRTAHESLFNTNDGRFRAPNSQQGYTGFSTWTRGLAWAITGFAEQLEYLQTISDDELEAIDSRDNIEDYMLKAAHATCEFFKYQV